MWSRLAEEDEIASHERVLNQFCPAVSYFIDTVKSV
jgi:hypothetical protein